MVKQVQNVTDIPGKNLPCYLVKDVVLSAQGFLHGTYHLHPGSRAGTPTLTVVTHFSKSITFSFVREFTCRRQASLPKAGRPVLYFSVTRPEMGLRKRATHGRQVQAQQEWKVRIALQ